MVTVSEEPKRKSGISTTRKKVISSKTQRDVNKMLLPQGSTPDNIITEEQAEQFEKLKKIIGGSTSSSATGAARASKSLVKPNKGKLDRESATAGTGKDQSPSKKKLKSSVSQASTTNSSMGRTQSKWLSSLAR